MNCRVFTKCLLPLMMGASFGMTMSYAEEVIPVGKVTKHTVTNQPLPWLKLHREYYVYVPDQYNGSRPAAVMVFQDGHTFVDPESTMHHPDVYVPPMIDELIHRKKIPVTIGVFVNPGHIDANYPANRFECSKRSEEYDETSDRYVSFLIDTLLPEVAKVYRLTMDSKRRAICGFSSGGNCAFTAAWQRPDYFHRVMSFSGSFVNIRGAHEYPFLIRGTPKKDLKVYLQCGSKDLDIVFGNWWLANQQMAAALAFRGYDHKFQKTTGQHGEFMGQHLKEALVWLWTDAVQ